MPHLATKTDPVALAHEVKRFHKEWHHLVAVKVPALFGTGQSDAYHLFGSRENDTQALMEAMQAYPSATRHGMVEHLDAATLARIKTQVQGGDPIARTFRSLGLVKPDGSPVL